MKIQILILFIVFIITQVYFIGCDICIQEAKFKEGQIVKTKLENIEGIIIGTHLYRCSSNTVPSYKIKYYVESEGYTYDWFKEYELIYEGKETDLGRY